MQSGQVEASGQREGDVGVALGDLERRAVHVAVADERQSDDEFAAVIDWEFVSCLPFLCAVPRLIEPMLREGLNGGEGGFLSTRQSSR
ncbi:hypothetical protein N658DRAFT_498660 [Parathielavia hyrcaniae]|uniref:Uncharacterized protein n=1 Tax=Parathielavia hyrcaniae TaxID=113614 RepID=A0AAN6PW66_9PEZI|nr:hypothetical protein N658DRAFT_498660 [Parathielavia hyrcaniae]